MDKICVRCNEVGKPKTITNGSIAIELVMWLCFIIPGIIYSIWRLTSRYSACGSCGSAEMVSLDSPVGKRLVESKVA